MWNSTTFESLVSADVGISRITGEEKKVDMTLLIESSSRKPEYSLCFKQVFLKGKYVGYSRNNCLAEVIRSLA